MTSLAGNDEQNERPPNGGSTWIPFCIGLLYCLICLPPWIPGFITNENLRDPSWQYALHEAHVQNWKFGSEVIFTYGPYGFVITRMYHPATFPLMLAAWMALSAVFYVHAWRLARNACYDGWGALLFAGAAVRLAAFDATTFLLSFLVIFLLWRAPPFFHNEIDGKRAALENQSRRLLRIPLNAGLVLAVGLLPLTKFTFVPAMAVVLAATVLLDASQRRFPFAALSAVGASFLWWLVSGQPLTGAGEYLAAGFELARHYEPAMSLWESEPTDVAAVWCGAALASLIPLLLRSVERGTSRFAGIIIAMTLFALLFLAWKYTFVRFHPLKIAVFYSSACLMALLAASGFAARRTMTRRQWAGVSVSAAMLLLATAMTHVRFSDASLWTAERIVWANPENPAAVAALLQGDNWMAKRHRDISGAIRTRAATSRLNGTIDVVPSKLLQGLIRDDAFYEPRPVMQSYAAYSPWLAERNAAHYASERAPDFVLFRVDPLDEQFPALCDGLLWRELLQRYEPQAELGSDLLFRRSSAPRSLKVADFITVNGTWNSWLSVPQSQPGLVWCRVTLSPTLGSKVASLAYKQPHVFIEVQTRASTRKFRFIAAAGESGFLLSPAVLTNDDFRSLIGMQNTDDDSNVVAVRFSMSGNALREWFYSDSITVDFERLTHATNQPAVR